MKSENLTIMAIIAMIWTIPLAIVFTVIFFIVSCVIYLIRLVLVFSGTAESAIWIIDKIKQRWKSHQWNKLKKQDGVISTIDSMMK